MKADKNEDLLACLHEIIDRHDSSDELVSRSHCDGGLEPLWPRFERAATNQIENGQSTIGRYAIWANTVGGNIVGVLDQLDLERTAESRKLLVRAANNLAAFSEFQSELEAEQIEWHSLRRN